MYPVLPLGPTTIPTGPVIVLLAVTLGLEIAGRYGRRLGLSTDDVWNSGLIAILAGLIVARLWNVIQFWPIYIAEPWLMVSLRPGGFVVLPGVIAALIAAYAYLLRHALAPRPIATALGLGGVATLSIVQAGALLTGRVVGIQGNIPWAVSYYDEFRHPVALYYAIGLAISVLIIWYATPRLSPHSILFYLLLSCGITYLVAGAYEDQAVTFLMWRLNQLVGLSMALVATLGLAYTAPNTKINNSGTVP